MLLLYYCSVTLQLAGLLESFLWCQLGCSLAKQIFWSWLLAWLPIAPAGDSLYIVFSHWSQWSPWLSLFPTGRITLSNWATAVESVLRLGLPWRMLRPQLVRSTADGMLEYKSWLDDLAMEQRSQEVQLTIFCQSTLGQVWQERL